jgi:phosphate transport system ATP-binding protein
MIHVAFRDVTVRYGDAVALDHVSLDIPAQRIFGVIGPAGSGKTTLLKCINRMVDVAPGARTDGQVMIDGSDVRKATNLHDLRRRVGMVLPLPVALPMSIYDNVAFAARVGGWRDRATLDGLVEDSLRRAALWDEVKDRLSAVATTLSGGQQQRLAIARALSHRPAILCLDDFSIAVDPVTTMKIEDALVDLKRTITIVVATNLVQQARRLADSAAFLNAGRLIEAAPAEVVFSDHPGSPMTREYVQGAFG